MEYKFNTKFNIGQILYTLINKKITKVKINKIEVHITITDCNNSITNIQYSLVSCNHTNTYLGYCYEADLYETKEELINNL